jgi:hypothetical protein
MPNPTTGAASPPPSPPAQQQGARRLGTHLVTIAAQVVSVVFAVLVALAVDEWWEERENMELGRRGVAAIAAEVRGNITQLEEDTAKINHVLARTDSALRLIQRGATDVDLNIDYPLALLSSAAWQTAQTTRAVHFVDIEQVIRIARVYDVQAFLLRNQDRLADMIADLGSIVADDPQKGIEDVRRRYLIVVGFRTGLASAYHCLLEELDGTTPPAAIECGDEPV